jgi:FAD/FMN-containing dehydrogenase
MEALLSRGMEDGHVADAVLAANGAQVQRFWQVREAIPLAQSQEGLNIKHDISLPISEIGAFLTEADAAVGHAAPGARLINFGHLGDGNLHYNVQAPEGRGAADFLAQCESTINGVVYDILARHGGSISAEHGIGSLKREQLPRYKSTVALDLMRRIKFALDPQSLMNPGRLL